MRNDRSRHLSPYGNAYKAAFSRKFAGSRRNDSRGRAGCPDLGPTGEGPQYITLIGAGGLEERVGCPTAFRFFDEPCLGIISIWRQTAARRRAGWAGQIMLRGAAIAGRLSASRVLREALSPTQTVRGFTVHCRRRIAEIEASIHKALARVGCGLTTNAAKKSPA